jgi:hypothetical protein
MIDIYAASGLFRDTKKLAREAAETVKWPGSTRRRHPTRCKQVAVQRNVKLDEMDLSGHNGQGTGKRQRGTFPSQ